MRYAAVAALALLALSSSRIEAQQTQRTLIVRFDNGAGTGDAGDVIARRQALRAWQDTVEVYLERATVPAGWRVMAGSGDAPRSGQYLVSVVAIPISKPGYSAMALSVALMEPATLTPWKFISHYVSVTESAQQAAVQLSSGSIEMLRAQNRN